jgi:hypothetical protein
MTVAQLAGSELRRAVWTLIVREDGAATLVRFLSDYYPDKATTRRNDR